MNLRVADDFTLPARIHTSTQGLLAIRGAGKSNAGRVMAEEMFKASLPFVAIDPVGAWWGLRSSQDGKAPGLPLPIFGGRHADVPLERGSGDLLADLVVEKRLTCVLDLSQFESEAAKKAFLLAFATRLYLKNEDPLHLFLEEADDYIPQKPMRDEAQLLRAFENIVRRGRSRGLGITLITQRSAAINKMVLTQVETLITLRTTSPQDRAAIEAWIKYHAQSQEILESLPSLADGEAWIWSPHVLGVTKKIRFRRSETFDSGATPKNLTAAERRKPATMADIDLAALKDRMASTIEKAKAEDPRELHRQIAALKAQLKKPAAAPAAADPRALERARAEGYHQGRADETAEAKAALARAEAEISQAVTKALRGIRFTTRDIPPSAAPRPAAPIAPRPARAPVASKAIPAGGPLPGAEKKILIALAQYPEGRSKKQVAILTCYAQNGGGFNNAIGALRSKGYVHGSRDQLSATEEGLVALGPYDPLPAPGPDLLQHWLRQLTKAEKLILEHLASVYPGAATKEETAAATGYEANGGGFNNAIGRLRTLELVSGHRDELRASEDLF